MITLKIKEQYGTIKRYCIVKNLNYNSFRNTLCQNPRPSSSKYIQQLIQDGLLPHPQDADETPTHQPKEPQ